MKEVTGHNNDGSWGLVVTAKSKKVEIRKSKMSSYNYNFDISNLRQSIDRNNSRSHSSPNV